MKYRFFLGTYTSKLGHVDGCGPGVEACELDSETGEFVALGDSVVVPNPSFLWLNEEGDRLYSICEICDYEGREDGALCCFSVGEEGQLKLLQQRSSNGMGPAYCRGDESGERLLVANYVGSNVNAYPIGEGGLLGDPVSSFRHTGTGANEMRQEAPHPHSIAAMPGNEMVFVGDLGIDQLVAYRVDKESMSIHKEDAKSVAFPKGSGPRHFVLNERSRILYVALELSSEIGCVRFDEEWSKLGEVETIKSHGVSGDVVSHPSEISLSPDGRHVYIANRELDCISGFEVAKDGSLKWFGDYACVGRTPRHMAFAPDGKVLVVAHQDSSSLDSYFRNGQTGELVSSGQTHAIGTPSYVEFA